MQGRSWTWPRGPRVLLAIAQGAPSLRRAPSPSVPDEEGRRNQGLVVAVFVASGAAGLMYQVVWSRQLVLVFGNTTEAIGTIVTAFMAGLGLGGLVGGLIAPRLRRPLRVYGTVELGVAAAALLVPFGFRLIEGAYHSGYDGGSPGQLTLTRLLLSLATVTPVTFLMGLTLPLLTRHVITSMRTAGSQMGRLYAANTFGAMIGTVGSGFAFVELLGLSDTTHLAVALNVLAGATALVLSAQQAVTGGTPIYGEEEEGTLPLLRRGLRRRLYPASFVSGFVALGLEILWTRMLSEGTGSRIYVFVVILAVYLLGIAVGGAIYRARSSPVRDTPGALAGTFLGIALSTVVTVPLGTRFASINMVAAIMLLPATVCMGYAFPLSARLLTRNSAHGSRSIGVLYAWNTAGSLLGSLTAAFILVGTVGTNGSILVLGAADAAVALLLLAPDVGSLRSAPLRIAAAGALVVVPTLLVVTRSPLLLTSTERHLLAGGLPFHHTEDRLSTVDAAGGPPSRRRLFVTGTAMTALSVDTKLMAYIPKVMRPNARYFLDICFGMGTTFRSALNLGMHTDAVDLSPSVPLQMPTFYPDAERYLRSPLARVITADGRNYVRLASRQYDLISVDPPPPIESAGTSVLYSREFYGDAHRRLRPGGLMLQWLYFGVDLEQLREHMRTFRSEFPHTVMLISPRHGGLYMLGSDAPIAWDDATVARFMETPQASSDLMDAPDYPRLPHRSWPAILDGMRWMQDGEVDHFVGHVPMITDDRPLTEYYALHKLFTLGHDENVNEAMLRKLSS